MGHQSSSFAAHLTHWHAVTQSFCVYTAGPSMVASAAAAASAVPAAASTPPFIALLLHGSVHSTSIACSSVADAEADQGSLLTCGCCLMCVRTRPQRRAFQSGVGVRGCQWHNHTALMRCAAMHRPAVPRRPADKSLSPLAAASRSLLSVASQSCSARVGAGSSRPRPHADITRLRSGRPHVAQADARRRMGLCASGPSQCSSLIDA